jgi:flagellar protein FliL
VYGGSVADANAAKKAKEDSEDKAPDSGQGSDKKSMILMILVVVNSLAFAGVGFGLYQYSKATREVIKSATEIGEVKDEGHGAKDEKKAAEHELKLVALETFYVNLDGSEGYKLLKVTMSLEVDSTPAQDEILKRQAQVRDMIIILLTSKRYGEVSGENAQDKLKAEIIDTVNSILTKGKIKKILFTEFLFQ